MNTVIYDVYKNTVKKADGFNPVNSEKDYTHIMFRFREGDDWEKCSIITASFFMSVDNIIKSNAEFMEDNLTASFTIPSDFRNQKGTLKIGIQGTYTDDNNNNVTISTNIISINISSGVIVTESVNQNIFEQIISLVQLINSKKADKASTIKYVRTNEIDDCIQPDVIYRVYIRDGSYPNSYHSVICVSGMYRRTQYSFSSNGIVEFRTATSIDGITWSSWSEWSNDIATLKQDLKTLNEGGLIIKDEVIAEYIQTWLNTHPEVTVAVPDHSLSIDKMAVGTFGYVTPEMFGAAADGETDDTDAINNALTYCYTNNKTLVFSYNKVYLISSAIKVHSMSNIKIVNNGIIHAKASGSTDSTDTTNYQYFAFSVKNSSYVDIRVGYVYSERVYYEAPPENHTSENTNGSNVVGVAIIQSNNISVHDYTARNLQYALICIGYETNEINSDGIKFYNFEVSSTSQPILISYCNDIEINNGKIFECPNTGRGHHFLYASRYTNTLSMSNVYMAYTTGHYGSAINLCNASTSASSASPDDYDDSKDLKTCHFDKITIDNCYQVVTVKAKTYVVLNDCIFNGFNGGIPAIDGTYNPSIISLNEYAELKAINCKFNFDEKYQLINIQANKLLNQSIDFKSCIISCGNIYVSGSDTTIESDNTLKLTIRDSELNILTTSTGVSMNLIDTATYDVSFYNTVINSNTKMIVRVNFDTVKLTCIGTTLIYNGENGALVMLYKSGGGYYSPTSNVIVCNLTGVNCNAVCNLENYAENIISNNNFFVANAEETT